MKKFDVIVIEDVEVQGVGYYQKSTDGMSIEADSSSITDFFSDVIRSKKIIGNMEFKGGGSHSLFSGNYLVEKVNGNQIKLRKA
ncbi:hypothetical protein J32TS6_19270 [Virgibacillus pantothenticus]|uniref:hypothetical protein n=1 Tax=Virgibacillus pantothenticus TaxID=1473 RepID=UPI001B28C7A1|nr:hypothetical protein [Virgibacillus pantothenticus]GIP63372.1 hypothetical protein J32TS6_19270 [Virgibacillus pantothenticus]